MLRLKQNGGFYIGNFFIKTPIANINSPPINHLVRYYNNGPDCEAGKYAYMYGEILCWLYSILQRLAVRLQKARRIPCFMNGLTVLPVLMTIAPEVLTTMVMTCVRIWIKTILSDKAVINADDYCYHYCDAQYGAHQLQAINFRTHATL